MTHAELVEIAGKWLQKKQRCNPVLTELSTHACEYCDAIGWYDAYSTLIECKTSRSDFKADMKKPFRTHPWLGVGQERYYMAPAGLLAVMEMPEGWGLLEVDDAGTVTIKHGSTGFSEWNWRNEIRMMRSALRRSKVTCVKGVCFVNEDEEASNA